MPREHESDEDLSCSTDDGCDISEAMARARGANAKRIGFAGEHDVGRASEAATGLREARSQVGDEAKAAFPRSSSPHLGSWDVLHKEEPLSKQMKRFDYGPEQDFVLHLPPSIGDEQDPTKEPDPTGALSTVEVCDDRRFYGMSTAWQLRQDMTDGRQELLARRRLRRKAWDSLVIPWNASDIQLRDSIPLLLKKLKEIDPTVDRDDVTQAIFKTMMCREQIKKVHENGIKVGYNSSLRETVFHTKPPDSDLMTFSGPNRYEDLRRHVSIRERRDAEREGLARSASYAAPDEQGTGAVDQIS